MGPCGNIVKIKYKLCIAIFISGDAAPRSVDVHIVQDHMQRIVNALVGPGGRGYKETAEVGNPLDGMGESIIPSLRTLETEGQPGAAEARRISEIAAEYALKAIAIPDLANMQRWGKVVCDLLRGALEAVDP
jgi:hypothetical protein